MLQCWHELDHCRPHLALDESDHCDAEREAAGRNMLVGLCTGQHIRVEVSTPLVLRLVEQQCKRC
jgi:hypothetical protein